MARALLSVSDKTGLVDFATLLSDLGYELLSTGGTFKTLSEAGLEVQKVADITGFPEILEGRVKTLHPRIHGGILAKRNYGHLQELSEHSISPIDVVVVNLYPFRETVAKPGVSEDEAIENIDIGGPTMIRAAAKNYAGVLVLVDPSDYARVGDALKQGKADSLRRELARKAFAHTAAYDSAIVGYFDRGVDLPDSLHLALERSEILRYGENPHQQGARYRERLGFWDSLKQHKGAALSYLNVFDTEAAWQLVHEFKGPACVIVKHANPCGVANGKSISEAYDRAFACDPKSAFGGIVALNQVIDATTAEHLMENAKADVIIARGYTPEALELVMGKRKNMRVLEANAPEQQSLELRRIDGGFLVQNPDTVTMSRESWKVVTETEPTDAQWQDLEMAWLVCAYTKSNAIALVKDGQAVGIGAGQQSRVDAADIAAKKAEGRAQGGACASDAFYPFRDGLDAAAAAGVKTVIQPGGSVNDQAIIDAANEQGIAMVFTGERHFRH
ncbi:MAG: bifunctional phosphoribosylaminoimidazolecarboxamide formyltransferase/IMP cyclohydrolase [Trueperaceae bacterium]|nr:bifunctional phosphoribosylaminoimidazolecarboxamide formyltransferase/IMP cyclohydrolase [Trueperaceae bacterium]